ncbi:GNAT family N-acetyltransferase [Streptomyces sp. NPDC018031]|uniref:GNAT family N-acetyltransferase n=1 Tax=Streptomyces sp. NPDC018031 TaxID=3365033 RepID=UPI0037891863
MSEDISSVWRAPLADHERVDLVRSHGGNAVAGWWSRIEPHSLGWVAARDRAGVLVGFVNVAGDGGDRAFLLDTKTRGAYQHRGIGTALVRRAVARARAAGREWLTSTSDPGWSASPSMPVAFARPARGWSTCRPPAAGPGDRTGRRRAVAARVGPPAGPADGTRALPAGGAAAAGCPRPAGPPTAADRAGGGRAYRSAGPADGPVRARSPPPPRRPPCPRPSRCRAPRR